MKKITVFTPTYNRAYILPKLYESLKKQTVSDFIWLIVDDGSIDDTKSLVYAWINERQLDIEYIYQKNAGKMSAHNRGVIECKTELFVCIDSDDWIVNDSIERILTEWRYLSDEEKETLCGMVAYRGVDTDKTIGNDFPVDIKKSTLSGLYRKGFRGDTTLIFKSNVIKQYLFPIIGNEKFITEAYAYDQIDLKYEYYLMRKIITVCEYRDDGLTQNLLKTTFKNPGGYTAYYMQKGNISNSFYDKSRYYIRANTFRHLVNKDDMPIQAKYKIIYNLMRPFGYMLYLKKKYTYSKIRGTND